MTRGPGPCPNPHTCQHTFHCPRCRAGSCAPGDAENRYCGACGYTDAPQVLTITPSAESIEQLNRGVAQFTAGLSRLSVSLKTWGALCACLNGDDERARAMLADLDAERLPELRDAAAALGIIASQLLTGERDEGQAAALDKAWLMQIRAEGINEAADKLEASGDVTSPYPYGSSMHPVWARATMKAAASLRQLAHDERRRADELRAAAEQGGRVG